MSDIVTLTLRAPLDGPLDLACVVPQATAGLDESAIAAMAIAGRRRILVGDVFHVSGGRSARIRIEGDLGHAHGIGAGMTDGEIYIDRSVGDRLGTGMRGGSIEVRGSAADDVGMGMAGGTLRVHGDVGDRTGGGTPGASKGMTGGEIIIDGSAGAETGARTRRGLIVVGGNTGEMVARGMIAGTVVVFGRTGAYAGSGNKRGSIVAIGGIDIPPTYRYACTMAFPFLCVLGLYLRRQHGLTVPDEVMLGRYQRYCGDAGQPGKGEILQWAPQ
jgi:formylmethanofuran dehydrogenase subunit C